MITYGEAGRLLALAAARDQRTVGDADVLAWHADLNEAAVTFDDAAAALTRFSVEMASREPRDRYRATTPDIIAIARRLRSERLENFMYEPDSGDESPAEYLRNLRGQISAVAEGRAPAPDTAPALEGGPHPSVIRELATVGRTVPNPDKPVKRPGPLGMECPKCQAPVGRPCRMPGSTKKRGRERPPHDARSRIAQGLPPADAVASQQEAERRREASRLRLAAMQQNQPAEGSAS